MPNYLRQDLIYDINRNQIEAIYNPSFPPENIIAVAFPIEISYCKTCHKLAKGGYVIYGVFDPTLVYGEDTIHREYDLLCVKDNEFYKIPVNRLYFENWVFEVTYLKEIGAI